MDRPDSAEIEAHLAAVGADSSVGEALRVLAAAALPKSFTVRFVRKGFIEHDLRFERDGHWFYSAVLNEGWVLFYFRRPAFREGGLDRQAVMSRFGDARLGARDEVKLRIHDRTAAEEVVALIAG